MNTLAMQWVNGYRVVEQDAGVVKSFEIPVVGMSFEGRDELVRKYANENDIVFLVREATNIYDRNAVKVVLGGDVQIGYIAKEAAAVLAPELDAGVKYTAFICELDNEIDYRIPEAKIRITREG